MKRIVSLFLVGLVLFLPSCKSGDEKLCIGVGYMDKILLPANGVKDGDGVLLDLIYSKLITHNADGSILCGGASAAAADGYRVYYADESFEESTEKTDIIAFEFTLKSGAVFSNGNPLTAEDVLFSLYYAIDPLTGLEKVRSLPIVGIENYLHQKGDMKSFLSVGEAVVKNGRQYSPTEEDGYNAEQRDLFWNCYDEAGEKFASEILEYVKDNYCTDQYIASYISSGFGAEDMTANNGLLTAYSMLLWNFGAFTYTYAEDENGAYVATVNEDGSFTYSTTYKKAMEDFSYLEFTSDENGEYVYDRESSKYVLAEADGGKRYSPKLLDKYVRVSRGEVIGFRDTNGTVYSLTGDSFPTSKDFFSVICSFYTKDGILDYKKLEETEAANMGDSVFESANTAFASILATEGAQPCVQGIREGSVTVDGADYSTVTVFLEGADFDAIHSFDIYILSKAHLTEGYEYTEEVVSCGMPLGSEAFREHIFQKTAAVGSGPYAFEYFTEYGAEFTANPYFETLGGDEIHIPYIEKLCVKEVAAGEEAKSVESGEVSICLVDAVSDKLAYVEMALPTYSSIVINPTHYLSLDARRALMSLMDLSLLGVEPLSCSMPDFMWEYTSCERRVTYDGTLAVAASYFETAGYERDAEGSLIDPATKERAYFEMTLLPTEEGSIADSIFKKAKTHLEELGALCEIVYDSDLMYNIYSDEGVGIYFVGWDMSKGLFDRYSLNAEAGSAKATGLLYLYENAVIKNFGTVEVTDGEENVTELSCAAAAEYLEALALEGKSSLDAEVRKENYSKALQIASDLSFELPLTTGKRQIAVSEDIDMSTLPSKITFYAPILSEIWNIKLK